MTRFGPFTINGFGDTPVTVRDEWACLLDRMDGSKQVLNGVSVDKITATFPRINLTAAVKEVKDDDPSNAELQSLRIPEFVGGDPDVLMGIFYESCHPIKVHTLPSGLFIGKLQLASHENKYTGVIGGPHASFRVLAEQAGGAANLMCTFVDGLKQYKNMGAPKIQAPLMTHEDIHFAKKCFLANV